MWEINYGDAKKSVVLLLCQLILVINNKNSTWTLVNYKQLLWLNYKKGVVLIKL